MNLDDFISRLSKEERQELIEKLANQSSGYRVEHELWGNGNLRRLTQYSGANKNGYCFEWDEDGQLALLELYNNGKLVNEGCNGCCDECEC